MKDRESEGPAPEQSAAADYRRLFEQSVERIDVGTANRLRLMRRDALAAAPAPRFRGLLAVAMTASVLLLIGLAWWRPMPSAPSAATPATATDLAALATAGDEDVELYAWLGEAPVAVDAAPGDSL